MLGQFELRDRDNERDRKTTTLLIVRHSVLVSKEGFATARQQLEPGKHVSTCSLCALGVQVC